MHVAFDGEVMIDYGQWYVSGTDAWDGDFTPCFAGQSNGLCGAALPDRLALITGLHMGEVPVRVELHDVAPGPAGPEWGDVVEAPFRVTGPLVIATLMDGTPPGGDLDPAPGWYRVRYCGQGFAAGRAADLRDVGEPPVDVYLLQFWPAAPAPDAVVRVSGGESAYWHGFAAGLPAPPPPPTPEEVAAREEADRIEAARAAAEAHERQEFRRWGGRRPTPTLRDVAAQTHDMVRIDRDLVFEIDAVSPGRQRAYARWAAREAYVVAGLAGVPWVAAALDALDAGLPLPPPFGDESTAFRARTRRFLADPATPNTPATPVEDAPADDDPTRARPLEHGSSISVSQVRDWY